MPTLGEFIARARQYGYTKHTIPNSRARDAPRVPETPTWRYSGACRLAADARKRSARERRNRRPLSPRPHTRGRLRVVALSQLSGDAASERRGAGVSCCLSGRSAQTLAEPAPHGAGPLYSSLHRHLASGYRNLRRPDASSHAARGSPTGGVDSTRVAPRSVRPSKRSTIKSSSVSRTPLTRSPGRAFISRA